MLAIDKKELIAQEEWALKTYEPFRVVKIDALKTKWKPVGLEFRFEGGIGLVAHFEGRTVEVAWPLMGDVARYQFAKDCEELLHRNVPELVGLDHGYIESLFYLMKCDSDRRILFGTGTQFHDAMTFLGDGTGLYYDLSNLASGLWAMEGNHRNAEIRTQAFMDSLEFIQPITCLKCRHDGVFSEYETLWIRFRDEDYCLCWVRVISQEGQLQLTWRRVEAVFR